jgi:hypothetical protein
MSAKQKAKHIADREAVKNPTPLVTEGGQSTLIGAEPTPDGLGAWEGGIAHRSLDGAKAKPQRTGDTKNRPGIDYASKLEPKHFCIPTNDGTPTCKATDQRCVHNQKVSNDPTPTT